MFQLDEESFKSRALIKVIGVGGGGGNAIKTMRQSGLTGVQFIVANTDVQALEEHEGEDLVLQMGAKLTGGLGAGANPEIGRQAAIESCEQIAEALKGANMVFITAGMGGGTGTGSAGVIARLAKEQGALTVGVVTRPFFFEGQRRSRHAEMGIQFLKENVDTLIVIPNQKLLTTSQEDSSLLSAFKSVDNILLTAVQGITDLINQKGLINLDFADVKTIMSEKGLAIIGTGSAEGEERALRAGQMLISSPLLEDSSFKGASGLIINIRGGADLSLKEVNQVADLISSSAHPDAEIIFGAIVDPDKSFKAINVTVIATGFEGQQNKEAEGQNQDLKKRGSRVYQSVKQPSDRTETTKSDNKSSHYQNQNIKLSSRTETTKSDNKSRDYQSGEAQTPLAKEGDQKKGLSIGLATQADFIENSAQEGTTAGVTDKLGVADKPQNPENKLSPQKPQTFKKKLPRDILLEKAKAYQEGVHKNQQAKKDHQQLSMNINTSKQKVDQTTLSPPPFKKQKSSLISFFKKADKTL